MIDKLNPNIRSIIHILNNWNFTFDGSYVRANLEIHITKEELLEAVPNARTVPQIFLDGELVGGFTELKQKLTESA